MTVHKVKEEFILKASIGELMAAMDGIVCAGVTAAKKGASTKTDPVACLGYNAAILSIDVRTDLSFGRLSGDRAAKKIMDFLKASRDVLAANEEAVLSLPKGATGGMLKDVSAHISEILVREDIGGERPLSKILNGNLQDKFKAAYLPKARKEDAEPVFDGDAADAPENKERKSPYGRRGRKKPYDAAAAPSTLA